MISEQVEIKGSGIGKDGWIKLQIANVSYDHPFYAPYEHALNIDFVNEDLGLDSRIAVELSAEAARSLVDTILGLLNQAEMGGHLE
jgi:hypothetical protein